MARVLGFGLGIAFGGPPGGPALNEDAAALVARMAVAPPPPRAVLISDVIVGLKECGVWDKLDGLWILAAHHAQAAHLNWRAPTMELAPVAAPVFTADRGYRGDGTTSYLSIPDAEAASSRYELTDASIGAWTLDAPAVFAAVMGRTDGRTYLVVNGSATTPMLGGRMNNTGGAGQAPCAADGTGLTHACRASGASFTLRQRDLPRVTVTQNNFSPRRPPIRLLAGSTAMGASYSTAAVAAAYFGAALTDAEELTMNRVLGVYMAAVGAA